MSPNAAQPDAAHPNPDVAARLARIYRLHRTEIDLRLGASPYLTLLEKLGNPHRRLPSVVHVAGTNGKGSTLAFLRAMIEAAGKTAHVYTSPHLVTFNERIRVNGGVIGDTSLIALYDRVEAANDGAPVTFFEFTTAMALLAFAENPADYTLLETGMGGRLDCTNVVDAPAATAITKISIDHPEFLGTTLPEIAAEKAGIMKPGTPCVIGAQMDPDTVLPVFAARAQELGIPLIPAPPLPGDYPAPSLIGAHQLENAATAVALAGLLGLPDDAQRHGLTSAEWPARMQKINDVPEIWFDAAHNDSGAQALGAQLAAWRAAEPDRPLHLVVGLAADKDAAAFFAPLAGRYDTLTLVDLPDARKPRTAAALQAALGILRAETAPDLAAAIERIALKNSAPDAGRIVIAGSLYLYQRLL